MNLLIALAVYIVAHASALVGIVLPPFVDLLNNEVKQEQERFLVTIVVCGLVAVLIDWNSLVLGAPEQMIATAGIIFMESQAIYKLYFKNSTLRGWMQNRLNPPEATISSPVASMPEGSLGAPTDPTNLPD